MKRHNKYTHNLQKDDTVAIQNQLILTAGGTLQANSLQSFQIANIKSELIDQGELEIIVSWGR